MVKITGQFLAGLIISDQLGVGNNVSTGDIADQQAAVDIEDFSPLTLFPGD